MPGSVFLTLEPPTATPDNILMDKKEKKREGQRKLTNK